MPPLVSPILTPRLRLEPITPALAAAARAGADALASALGASAVRDWAGASLALVGRSAPDWSAAPIRALVVRSADRSIIGDVRFEPSTRANCLEIGYSIARSERRRGYAGEAAGAIVDWLLFEAGEKRLIAGCDRRNVGSVRVLRRLGFWLDGAERGAFWWLLTPELRAAALDAI